MNWEKCDKLWLTFNRENEKNVKTVMISFVIQDGRVATTTIVRNK